LLIFTDMRKRYLANVKIPEGVECEFDTKTSMLKCKRDEVNLERKISILGTDIKIENNEVKFVCGKANKKIIAIIISYVGHINNMLKGIEEKFTYELEIAHVHFPITAKVENEKFLISNFLGEKVNRSAKILEGVEVEIKGQKVSVSGHDIEKTGQTAANIEKAAKVPKKDRRVFQDGIFMTQKPGGTI